MKTHLQSLINPKNFENIHTNIDKKRLGPTIYCSQTSVRSSFRGFTNDLM